MNGRGGYCVSRYGGMSKVDSIMLKFRPIAPKPVPSGSGSGGSTAGNYDGYVNCERRKRKYVRVSSCKRRSGERKKMKSKNSSSTSSQPVETLSLLPETPDRKEHGPYTGFSDLVSCDYDNNKKGSPPPVWLSFNKLNQVKTGAMVTTPAELLSPSRQPHVMVVSAPPIMVSPPPRMSKVVSPPPRMSKVVSNVTVECVTDTWADIEGLGCTDEERVINMEKDTCPGFISDGEDNVVWTNKAYKMMAGGDDHMAVVLVRKDKTTPSPAFTCKVRVSSAAHSGRKTPSPSSPTLTLPCDVWRMQRGACAWRLDVKAALSLGR